MDLSCENGREREKSRKNGFSLRVGRFQRGRRTHEVGLETGRFLDDRPVEERDVGAGSGEEVGLTLGVGGRVDWGWLEGGAGEEVA